MTASKFLADTAWKEVASKHNVKDNGLLKALAAYKRVPDDRHDDALRLLDEIGKLGAQAKKAREVASAQAAQKFLTEMLAAVDAQRRELQKAKTEHAKVAAAKKPTDDDDDDESPALLTTKMLPLLRQVAKGETMHVLAARAGKRAVVMLSRKPIPPARRKLLADQLDGAGSVKYVAGTCTLEAGATTFTLQAEVAGLAKLLRAALLEQTGLRVAKLRCRGDDGDDEERDDGAAETAAPLDAHDVPGDARGRSREHEALAAAPEIWLDTREMLASGLDELRSEIGSRCADEEAAFRATVQARLAKLDRILARLDGRLVDSLAKAGEAADPDARRATLEQSQAIVAEYVRYVRTEPLLDHLDRNPFGVQIELKASLMGSLAEVSRTITAQADGGTR